MEWWSSLSFDELATIRSMNDFAISHIRTYVPMLVGLAVGLLEENFGVTGIESDALIAGLSSVVTAVYYAAARWLETRWPQAGLLLGARVQPSYGD